MRNKNIAEIFRIFPNFHDEASVLRKGTKNCRLCIQCYCSGEREVNLRYIKFCWKQMLERDKPSSPWKRIPIRAVGKQLSLRSCPSCRCRCCPICLPSSPRHVQQYDRSRRV